MAKVSVSNDLTIEVTKVSMRFSNNYSSIRNKGERIDLYNASKICNLKVDFICDGTRYSTKNWFVLFTMWKDNNDIKCEKTIIENDIYECSTRGELRNLMSKLHNESVECAVNFHRVQVDERKKLLGNAL